MTEGKYSGKNVTVTCLDTGIFPHADFGQRILAFRDFLYYKRTPYDDNGHGTHVAGILAGSGEASGGKYRGAAPECSLIMLKVLDQMGNGRKEDVLRAFQWIITNYREYKIRIVNISVGTACKSYTDHSRLIAGVEELWDAGLVVVAAAGNAGPGAGSVTAPGSSRKIITVGSSDLLDGKHPMSGRGPTSECICKPDLVAPGRGIISCAPKAEGYFRKSGTSMSTPYISGCIACMLEKKPFLSNVEIKMMLKECTDDLGFPHNLQGWGKFNEKRFFQL